MGIPDTEFYNAIQSFQGAAKRLQLINKNDLTNIYLDFAHSPSKLKATVNAVKEQFPERKLIACMELHTFSSLNHNFLDQYKGSMNSADVPIVYFDPKAIEHKKLPQISISQVKKAFKNPDILVYNQINDLEKRLLNEKWKNKNLLLMSSGNFSGMDIPSLTKAIL